MLSFCDANDARQTYAFNDYAELVLKGEQQDIKTNQKLIIFYVINNEVVTYEAE